MAALVVMGSLSVVFLRRPVHAALGLVLAFFVLGFIYMSLGSTFLGISQIMVYAGAIMVLFLFVVMMLRQVDQRGGVIDTDIRFTGAILAALVVGAGLGVGVLSRLNALPSVSPPVTVGSPGSLGFSLFADYVWPFEMVSVLLLVGIVGSIMLAKRKI
jgi:NADH-quinone oxidoreductase subunit J